MNEHSNRGSSPDGSPLSDHDKSPDASLDDAFNDIFESDEWVGLELEVFPPEAPQRRSAAAPRGEGASGISSPTANAGEPSTAEVPAVNTPANFEGSVEVMAGPRVQVQSSRPTQVNFQGPSRVEEFVGDGADDDDVDDVDGYQTMFGRPVNSGAQATADAAPAKVDDGSARGPWTTPKARDPEEGRATFKPWDVLEEGGGAWEGDGEDLDGELDVRKTFFGKLSPFARGQKSTRAPQRVTQTEETGRPAAPDVKPGPRLPRFGAGGGRPAPFRAPERVPARATGKEIRRRSSGTLVGAPAVKDHDHASHKPARSGAADTVEKVNPNPDVGPSQKGPRPRPRPRPSGSRTAALPALFAANKEDGATLEDDGKKTDPPWVGKKTRGAMSAPPVHGDGLFRVPSRESLKRRTASRRTLSGVPAVSGGDLSKLGVGASRSSESSPGEYVMGKAKLTQSSSRIRVRRESVKPSRTMTGMPRVELPMEPAGQAGPQSRASRSQESLTIPMAAPKLNVGVVGRGDVEDNPLQESRGRERHKPGVTRPLSVPVFGQRMLDEGAEPEGSASPDDPHGVDAAVAQAPVIVTSHAPPRPEKAAAVAYAEPQEVGALKVNGDPLLGKTPAVHEGPVGLDVSEELSAPPVNAEGAASEVSDGKASDPQEPTKAAAAGEVSVKAPAASEQATSLKKTAAAVSVAKQQSSGEAAYATTGMPSEWPVRAIAMLAGAMCWVATVSFVVSLGDVDVRSLPFGALAALGSLLVGGLVIIAVGVMKLHMALRALMMGLVGVVCGVLLVSSEWMPLSAYGDASSRWLVFATLLLPMGLFWRSRYPKSSLSRVVVGVGMLLLLANYLAPVSGGVLRFESILVMLTEPGGFNMVLGGAAMLPLVLWLPSLLAFRSGERGVFGVSLSLVYCGCLLLLTGLWAASSLQPDEGGELLRWVGCGLASTAIAASFSAGGGELLGWMTRPDGGD